MQAEVVRGVGITLTIDHVPAMLGDNRIRAEVIVGRRPEIANRSVWLTYVTPNLPGPPKTLRMRPAAGPLDTFEAMVRFDKPGRWTLTVKVLSPNRPPVSAAFVVPCCDQLTLVDVEPCPDSESLPEMSQQPCQRENA